MITAPEGSKTGKSKALIFEDSYSLTDHLLKMWIGIAQESVQRKNRFTVALSGGRSPMEFYCRLSALKDFDIWHRTHIFLGDERFVPQDDPKSNFKMIKENLLDYVGIPIGNIHPIQTTFGNVGQAAEQYKSDLIHFFEFKGNAPCFDMILLGVGEDGHTASLFPDDPNIGDPDRITLPVSLPHLKEDRISIGLPVINNARHIIALMTGASKAEIVYQILKEKMVFPSSMIKPSDGQLTYLLDQEAARKLAIGDSLVHEGRALLYTG